MKWLKDLLRSLFGGPKEIPKKEMDEKINRFQDQMGIPEDELPEMFRDEEGENENTDDKA